MVIVAMQVEVVVQVLVAAQQGADRAAMVAARAWRNLGHQEEQRAGEQPARRKH